jgi:hypothetical protein
MSGPVAHRADLVRLAGSAPPDLVAAETGFLARTVAGLGILLILYPVSGFEFAYAASSGSRFAGSNSEPPRAVTTCPVAMFLAAFTSA